MILSEVVLLYDIMSSEETNRISAACKTMDATLRIVRPYEYKVPIGFLSYGTEDQIQDYLVDSESVSAFERPMLVLAGFTNERLHSFLTAMRNQGASPIALKAVLTEYNAVWDSISLYEELKKEDEYMHSSSGN